MHVWLPLSAGGTIAGPVGLLGTTFHELGHAVAAVLSGFDVEGMVVRSDGSGTTYVSGSPTDDTGRLAVASAGYLGALLWAAVLLFVGRWPRASRAAFFAAGAVLVLTALVWMDGVFAFMTAALLGGAAIVLGVVGKDRWIGIVATVLGAVLAFSGLSDAAGVSEATPDAAIAADASGLGTTTIRFVWLLVGFALVLGAIAARALIARRGQPPAPLEATDGTA